MTSQAKTDIDLMQHVDGELDARGVTAVRAQLERDPDARSKVESLEQMSELVRGHLELSVDAIPDRRFDAMWREIDKATVPSESQAIERQPATGLWARISGWFERHRGHVFTGMASAGAVAALALVLRPDHEVVKTNPSAIDVQPAALRSSPIIEELETPGGTGTVLNLEDEDGHTTVIWVTPTDTVEGI
jgi:anti-sigma factor RsiW